MELYYSLQDCCINFECKTNFKDLPQRLSEIQLYQWTYMYGPQNGNCLKIPEMEGWQKWIDNCLELDLLLHAEDGFIPAQYVCGPTIQLWFKYMER